MKNPAIKRITAIILLLIVAMVSSLSLADGIKFWQKKAKPTTVARKKDAPPVPLSKAGGKGAKAELRTQHLEKTEAEHRPERFDQPEEAAQFFLHKRSEDGRSPIPFEKYASAMAHAGQMPQYSTMSDSLQPSRRDLGTDANILLGNWTPLGPGNIGGRTRAMLINPTSPNIIYAAGVAGGVWKSVDSGANWTPIADSLANLAVCSLVMDPTDPNVIYAGTGEGFFNIDAVRGAGIFKTTDGGTTWTQLASTAGNSNFYYVNDLVISPTNHLRVYAATRTGLHRSTDGGASWTQIFQPAYVSGGNTFLLGCHDLVIRTDQPTDQVLVSCGNLVRAHVYRNPDAGGAGVWTDVLSDTTSGTMGRTSLAIAKSNQNVMYALASELDSPASGNDYQYALHAVFKSVDGGATWTAQRRNTGTPDLNTAIMSYLGNLCTPVTTDFTGQGWYDNVIAVDPADSNRVWVGGIYLMRSDDGGVNWGYGSIGVHTDQHAIVFHPNYDGVSNQIMFVGNDGGLYKTTNARAAAGTLNPTTCQVSSAITWTTLNHGYGVTQFYHGVPYPNGATYFGGAQDNGTVRGNDAGGVNAWTNINGGDGGYVAVDSSNTNVLYAEYTDISIRKSTNGGTSFSNAITGISDTGQFINPFSMDPGNSQRLWTGGTKLWRTTNAAANWMQASAAISGQVSAIAIYPNDGNYVLAGTDSGFIHRTTIGLTATAATTWASVQPRSGYVSWVTFDPTSQNIGYATYSTFGGGAHVWRSVNGGASWTGIDGSGATGIPDIPVHCLVVDPNNTSRIYVGTDLGVMVTTNGGASWSVENTGFANVITEALALNTNAGITRLFAFTHGRGAWRSDVCAFAISPASATVAAGAGSSPVTVTAGAACNWSVTGAPAWITPNPASGSGNGATTLNFSANAGAARMAALTVAGQSFTLIQASTNPGADTDGDSIPDVVELQEGRNPLVKDNDVFSNNNNSWRWFAMQQYRDFLGREGDPAGIAAWTGALSNGTLTRAQVVESFFNSTEFSNTVSPVVRLYFAAFNRIPDYGGLIGWVNAYRTGTPLPTIAEAFATSPEFLTTYGSLDNTQYVTLLYNNVLGRPPDAGGLAGWVNALNSNTLTRGQVLLGFSESAEYINTSSNKVFVTMMYVGMLRRSPEQAGFDGWVASLVAGTPRLTLIQSFIDALEYHNRFLP